MKGWTNGWKFKSLYRAMLKAGATKKVSGFVWRYILWGLILAERTCNLIGSITTICPYKIYLHTNPITYINEILFCFSHFYLPTCSHPSQTCPPLQCHSSPQNMHH